MWHVQINCDCTYKDIDDTMCKWNRDLGLFADKTLPYLHIFFIHLLVLFSFWFEFSSYSFFSYSLFGPGFSYLFFSNYLFGSGFSWYFFIYLFLSLDISYFHNLLSVQIFPIFCFQFYFSVSEFSWYLVSRYFFHVQNFPDLSFFWYSFSCSRFSDIFFFDSVFLTLDLSNIPL